MRVLVAAAAVAAFGCRLGAGKEGGAQLILAPAEGPNAPEVRGVIGGDLLLGQDGALQRVDPATRTARWTLTLGGALLSPPDGRGELWFIAGRGSIEGGYELVRVDAERGAVLGRTELPDGLGRWHRQGDALVRLSPYELVRHDPADGSVRWQAARKDLVDSHASFSRDAIWMFREGGLCGFALADGAERGCVRATVGRAMAAPDGDLVAVATDGALIGHDAATLKERWRAPLPAGHAVHHLSVTGAWIGLITAERAVLNGAHAVRALRATDGAEVWRRDSRAGVYFAYLHVGGDLLSYYESGDTSQWAVRLPGGARTQVHRFHETFVLLTDATGTAPAVPDGDPHVAGDLVLVTSFYRTWVYRIPR